MSRRYAVIAALFIVVGCWVYYMYRDNHRLKTDNVALNGQLSAQQVINATTITAVTSWHRISLDNIKAKQAEDTEHVKVKTVIKTVFKDSECIVAPVSADTVNELRKYANEIRARTSGSDTGAIDSRL